ncbi:MAG: glycosyltransferase family 2 protein [bacterium]|nr:glycosyltransferase family 2 protein [bacterium]
MVAYKNARAEKDNRPKISATIICLNEERNIRRCLESLDFVDEIVVVDSGSTDRTVEICRQFTDRVLYHPWTGHVQQKNYALEQASHEWILSLDADEVVTPKLKSSILHALQNDQGKYDGYRLNRHVFYLGRWIDHCWYPEYKIRLFKKSKGRWTGKNPHDTVSLEGGRYRDLDGDLEHYTYQNISDHLRTIDSFSTIGAQEKFKEGKPPSLYALALNPLVRFLKLYVVKRGFLDGVPGLIIAALGSYYCFLKYAKLWEMHRVPAESSSSRLS